MRPKVPAFRRRKRAKFVWSIDTDSKHLFEAYGGIQTFLFVKIGQRVSDEFSSLKFPVNLANSVCAIVATVSRQSHLPEKIISRELWVQCTHNLTTTI